MELFLAGVRNKTTMNRGLPQLLKYLMTEPRGLNISFSFTTTLIDPYFLSSLATSSFPLCSQYVNFLNWVPHRCHGFGNSLYFLDL